MKRLFLIGGPMGVGKSAVCEQLVKRLQPGVYLDGDWCWHMRPFSVTDATKAMVMDNICALLGRFLACPELDNVVFGWVMHRQEIIDAIRNIRAHGLSVRGLFILGSDDQEAGVGDQLADFVIQNHIQGTLIQCMYFVPGTPVYEANRDRLLHQDWSKYNGNAVHFPRRMTPYQLQLEHIRASRKIYSWRRLFSALVREDPIHKLLFLGEFFWHMSVRSDLKKELPYLKRISEQAACAPH